MRSLFLFVLLVFCITSSFGADALLPLGGDEPTQNANLAWDPIAKTYTFSCTLRSDTFRYIIDVSSPEIQTGRFKVKANVNSASFTPMQAASPLYTFSGTLE